nr:flagellar hook-associated protein 3 [Lachnospiraceae bacterium]
MMRITNAMMTSNTKNNININKLNEDKLNTQIATGQVISRPSDDPVVAIRALRLNTNLSQLTQYYKKNIPDAQAWLNVTETALKQTDQIFTNIKENLTTGASDTNTSSDRQKILESLKGLRSELYAAGNADYAERTVFTDYRTQKSLTFLETDKDLDWNYKIHETFDVKELDKINYVSTYDAADAYPEGTVEQNEIYRIRLSYDNLNETGGT